MLYELLSTYREAIIARTVKKVRARPWPVASSHELEHGVPLFLTQLTETLRSELTATPFSAAAIGASAACNGRELMAAGFDVSQVVHDYGDICQAITELAVEHRLPITVEEFHTLNRCLDTAIAEAVTEHARLTAQVQSSEALERSGQVAHEVRDLLNGAIFAFEALKRGTVAINGSTGAVLGRSLMSLRDLVNSTLSDTRMAAHHQQRERVLVTAFLAELAAAGRLHADYRGVHFTFEPVDPLLAITVDPQLLGSAVTNLLNNAFKYTRTHGRVVLRGRLEGSRVIIEVEDECGGLPVTKGDPFQAFGDRRGRDRTGLGLGLSIARKAVRAHAGDIRIQNQPGRGCRFIIDVPVTADEPVPHTAA